MARLQAFQDTSYKSVGGYYWFLFFMARARNVSSGVWTYNVRIVIRDSCSTCFARALCCHDLYRSTSFFSKNTPLCSMNDHKGDQVAVCKSIVLQA